jgi:hypothetical protein
MSFSPRVRDLAVARAEFPNDRAVKGLGVARIGLGCSRKAMRVLRTEITDPIRDGGRVGPRTIPVT